MKVDFRKPTQAEVNLIIEQANVKKEKLKLKIMDLCKTLDVHYCDLHRVLNGKLVNYKVVAKLNEWINE